MSTQIQTHIILAISQYYTTCVNFIILFAGVFGHTIDIIIFTNCRSFRNKQSAFYLTAESFVNSILLIIFCTSRIAIDGFNNDLRERSIIWCKIRQSFGTSCTLLSLTMVCFAAIDQYLATSYYPFLKQFSTLKLAHRLTYGAIIISIVHEILFLAFMKIQPTYGCTLNHNGFNTYITYVHYLILTGLLPIIITSTFATLAYINVRHFVRSQIAIFRRRFDRQLTAMILARVAFLVTLTLPYVIYRIYTEQIEVKQKQSGKKSTMQLISAIAHSLFYLNYAGSFYLFLLASKRFRRQVKYLLLKKYCKICSKKIMCDNRIAAISHKSNVECD